MANDIDGGDAVSATTIFVPCTDGLIAVSFTIARPALKVSWRTSVGGGPPIVAGGLVWTIGQQGTLFGLDPTTGATAVQLPLGSLANHFPTPSVGDGLLLAASADQVHAYAGPAPGRPTTSAPARPVVNAHHPPGGAGDRFTQRSAVRRHHRARGAGRPGPGRRRGVAGPAPPSVHRPGTRGGLNSAGARSLEVGS